MPARAKRRNWPRPLNGARRPHAGVFIAQAGRWHGGWQPARCAAYSSASSHGRKRCTSAAFTMPSRYTLSGRYSSASTVPRWRMGAACPACCGGKSTGGCAAHGPPPRLVLSLPAGHLVPSPGGGAGALAVRHQEGSRRGGFVTFVVYGDSGISPQPRLSSTSSVTAVGGRCTA